jgi:hypothetical protein
MDAGSKITNEVTIRSPSISSQLICQRKSIGVAKGAPRLVQNA